MTSSEIKICKPFQEGIYFSCEMCGGCCKGFDEGEVFLYSDDLARLIKYLNVKQRKYNLKKFAREYLKLVDTSFYWKEPGAKRGKNYNFQALGFKFIGKDEHCEFLDQNNTCTVHEARPFQCKAFPIGWNMLIASFSKFKNYSRKCPALRKSLKGKGQYFSKEKILAWAKKEYEMEKEFFLKMKNHDFDIFKVYPFLPKDIDC
ncbi:MAG: hypothetical protein GF353_29295 [Candidatus Lokiarchaeota archaeon]|nr:hypothetical protein [Candidatus Lokiarchaeota archaeon]